MTLFKNKNTLSLFAYFDLIWIPNHFPQELRGNNNFPGLGDRGGGMIE